MSSRSNEEKLNTANELAARRGSRVFSNDDLIFQIRHDTPRVERLRNFLAWKAIRKTVKDTDEKDGLANEAFVDAEDADKLEDTSISRANVPSVNLPWDLGSIYSVQIPDTARDNDTENGTNENALAVLRRNDARTRDMTVAEYQTWSEYRHASFTWRKSKRFRDWSGLGVIAEHRPNDDSLDILGYLTSEMVQKLTAAALEVHKSELLKRGDTTRILAIKNNGQPGSSEGLFLTLSSSREPINERHIRTAFQRMQILPKKRSAMSRGLGQHQASQLQLVCIATVWSYCVRRLTGSIAMICHRDTVSSLIHQQS